MFISLDQIQSSLARLCTVHPFFGMSYLAFKEADLPVGRTKEVVFSNIADRILQTHYQVAADYDGFYSPFKTSSPAKRWLAKRYGSTSLQRITTDTFGHVFIHEKGTSKWGWQKNYIETLRRKLGPELVPAFDLAVWLFRDHDWPDSVTRGQIRNHLFKEYNVAANEKGALFDTALPREPDDWLSEKSVSESELLEMIGYPPGSGPQEGALLRYLEIDHVGPAAHFAYEPAERLNILTGDNSLGKTFLLDVIWWTLTGSWCSYEAMPRRDVSKQRPKISFEVTVTSTRVKPLSAEYNWKVQRWDLKPKREAVAGLVVYSRFDGSFAIFDPSRTTLKNLETEVGPSSAVIFDPRQVWDGLRTDADGRDFWVCNGLILDWVRWQTGGDDYRERFDALIACLKALSPSESEPLTPGKPQRRFPLGARESPTLLLPYGEVPVQLASAGIRRIVALAYMLVWSWYEHLAITEALRSQPQRRLVLMVDEVEAHLHPRWQRVIAPALMNVVERLSTEVSSQLHVATHSPMVLASAESCFSEGTDALHHLRLEGKEVVLQILPFVKRGPVDRWLMSEVFGLDHARSVDGAQAIEDAKRLLREESPNKTDVGNVHSRLINYLAPDDEFWPRWIFFARELGVGE